MPDPNSQYLDALGTDAAPEDSADRIFTGKLITKITVVPIDEDEYRETAESNQGYCKVCEEFTTDFVEPDAENYHCDQCGTNSVCGAEQALLLGLITIV